jgi:7-cyano-7-deazaguanine synthase
MDKVVVVLSGGMDSATLLYHLIHLGHEAKAISIDYGQRHVRELRAAAELCRLAGVEHVLADLTGIRPLLGDNSLSARNVAVPDGHYADETMKLTVVPNRNMILLAVATAWAVSLKYDAVAYGAHAGDHTIYPDCRPEFAAALDEAVQLCDWHKVRLLRPFVDLDKGRIARLGHALGVPFHLTWTCYNGGEKHCGTCGACHERREAFSAAGLSDPTEYVAGRGSISKSNSPFLTSDPSWNGPATR